MSQDSNVVSWSVDMMGPLIQGSNEVSVSFLELADNGGHLIRDSNLGLKLLLEHVP